MSKSLFAFSCIHKLNDDSASHEFHICNLRCMNLLSFFWVFILKKNQFNAYGADIMRLITVHGG